MVQEKLGIAERQCPAFDVNSVCAGFVFALNVAQGMMLTDARALPERAGHRHGRLLQDPELEGSARPACSSATAPGAVLLSHDRRRRATLPLPPGQRRARARVHRGARRAARACRSAAEVIEKRLNKFVDGRAPGVGVRHEHRARDDPVAARASTASRPRDLDLLILHQSNLRMLEAIMTTLELPMEKTVTTIESYGNTAAASIPLTLQKAWEDGPAARGLAGDVVRFRRRPVLGRRAARLVTRGADSAPARLTPATQRRS